MHGMHATPKAISQRKAPLRTSAGPQSLSWYRDLRDCSQASVETGVDVCREGRSALRCHGQWHDPYWCQSQPWTARLSQTSPAGDPEAPCLASMGLGVAPQICSANVKWMLLRARRCHLMERLGPAEGNLAFCLSDSPHWQARCCAVAVRGRRFRQQSRRAVGRGRSRHSSWRTHHAIGGGVRRVRAPLAGPRTQQSGIGKLSRY